jgi:hypothetical protein
MPSILNGHAPQHGLSGLRVVISAFMNRISDRYRVGSCLMLANCFQPCPAGAEHMMRDK